MSLLSPLQTALSSQQATVKEALARANSNVGRNVFLALDRERVLAEAEALTARFPEPARRPPLFGVPIGVKDCFDVAGYPTTCGSHFYAAQNGIAAADSAVAVRLREAGALIMGKTHLHQLAYGITGENSEYGDCAQPENELPSEVRAQIISLSMWVGRHTAAVVRREEGFEPLIDLNRTMMQGLSARVAAA